MSKSKCTGACCKHVAQKLSTGDLIAAGMSDSRYEMLTKRADESKKLADLYRELGIIHGQYAEDVDQLLFEVSAASTRWQGLATGNDIGNACILPKAKSSSRIKVAVKKSKYDLAS